MRRVLITGGAGFFGHHLVQHVFRNTDWHVVTLDRLDHSGNLGRLGEILDGVPGLRDRHSFVWHDLRAAINGQIAAAIGKVSYIFHLAANSAVERSIADPVSCVYDNVIGTVNTLEFARQLDCLDAFINFSTDEVFGPAPEGVFYHEWARYNSTNPYSASKAGAEELGLAFANTYKLPVITSHCMNLIGERQHPEKFVPLVIKRVLSGEKVYIYTSPKSEPGSRHYLHARNAAAAAMYLCEHGTRREKYNIVGDKELNNLEMAQLIAEILEKPLDYELVDFHSDRPGHDLRYALSDTMLFNLGYRHPVPFDESLRRTIKWTLQNPHWL